MAEQGTDHHHTADDTGKEAQSTNMDHVSASDECKQDETDVVKQQLLKDSASTSASTNRGTNGDNGDAVVQPHVEKGSSPPEDDTTLKVKDKSTSRTVEGIYGDDKRETPRNEQQTRTAEEISIQKRIVPLTQGSSPPDDDTTLKVKENSTRLPAEEGSRGDYERETTRNEQLTATVEEIARENDPGVMNAPETTTPPTLGGKKEDEVDGPDEETPDYNTTITDPREDDESCPEKEEEDRPESILSPQTEDVETIGPAPPDTADAEPVAPAVIGNRGVMTLLIAVGLVGLVTSLLLQHLFQPTSPSQKYEVRQIDIFLRQLEKVKTQFPNQRKELWNRSKIHLLRHLETAQPTEPVSLILTAGHRGERTLRCLARSLASAFSTSLNASVLHIDGASKASQDSDQVKLDIDSKLQGAFEGDKPVAVINRFEELPPGSTLIFYRYCDHENAAYKKTCLIFTVLLGEEEDIPAETRLSTVEEMVDDHLQKKFLSDGHPLSFDRMDLDKYSGLWSRISHLILPVAAEERIEHEGC